MNHHCQNWRSKLNLYADGELPSREDLECGEHIRGCPECNAHAMGVLLQKRITRAAGKRYQPSADLRRKVMGGLVSRSSPAPWRAWVPQLAAASLFILITFIGITSWPGLFHANGQNISSLRALVDLHSTALATANPVEVVSSDRHTVKPWFQGKLPFSFDLPEPDGGPYTLLGARMAFFDQQPAAHLIYAYKQHRISVFIFVDREDALVWDEKTDIAGIHAETWKQNGLRYVVVGDAAYEALHALAEKFRPEPTNK